jgi:glycosyltransferase involved in cell wall biosynthesis
VPCSKLERLEKSKNNNLHVVKIELGCDTNIFNRNSGWSVPNEYKNKVPLLVLGRLDPIKGHERIIKIAAKLFAKWPTNYEPPLLHIIGEPANLNETDIKRYAESVGLELNKNILLTSSRVANIKDYLCSAAVGIIPSLGSEIICRVAYEFLLCGTPIVVSDAGALQESLFDESAGQFFKNIDDEDVVSSVLLEEIKRSLSEGEGAKQLRSKKAESLYSIETMAHKLTGIL